MPQWEDDLKALASDGWSYGFAQVLDMLTGELLWVVDISRRSVRFVAKAPTMKEAVWQLYEFITVEAPGESRDVH